MKPLIRSFMMLLRQISKDSMLYAAIMAPLLAGVAFHFGVPWAESALCTYFNKPEILPRFYLLFDLFLAVITPYIFCFASSMVMLTEYDENIAAYMAVTPVGKRGYILSRLVLPAVISIFVSFMLMRFFALSQWEPVRMLLTCVLTAILSLAVSLLLVSFSHNRVEGMAIAKLAGIIMLGLPVPFFIFSNVQYVFSLLPSFWIAKVSTESNNLFALPAVLSGFLWLWILYGRFEKKLS